jgi:hypothetical protein
VISKDHPSSQRQGGYALVTANKAVTQLKPYSTRQDVGIAAKYNFAFFTAGNTGKKGNFDWILNLKISYSGSEVSVAH